MKTSHEKKFVVIGGGTGTSTVVSGLKTKPVKITALVSVADSGGSTGRLRDEFGFQPVGDLRQSLAALAKEGSQEWIRKLLLYRFEKGEGLKGHNLGNLILTALQDMAGSTTSALEIAEQIFQLRGEILPVTARNVQLVIEYEDGTVVIGEDNLNEHVQSAKKIRSVRLSPRAKLYKEAVNALREADVIVIGPGDYYASILAALSVEDMAQVMRNVTGKIVYVVNLMTRLNQTHNMSALDHLQGIEQAIGRTCDAVIVNNGKIPNAILKKYAAEHEFPVVHDLRTDPRCITRDVVSHDTVKQVWGDTLERSLLRHDARKLAEVLLSI
jgi:uncharacterized cofD-like protein